jgi:hypothetical protein
MKINWNILGGYALGTTSMCFYTKAYEFFPDNTDQGWTCVMLYLFVCVVTASHALEKS